MKKLIILIFAVSYSVAATAQIITKEQATVQQTIIKLFNALSNRDSVSLLAHSTANITFYEYGQVWNIDTLILKAIVQNKSTDFKRTNSFEFINTTVDKTLAWVTYRLQSAITMDSKQLMLQWLETIILVKAKRQWKVNHLHSTLIKRS